MVKHLTNFAAVWLVAAGLRAADTRVTVLHFSDYHSHARPFYAEGSPHRGGIARAIRYLREEKRRGNTLVFNGGDMMNAGSPAWSDKYSCAEWPWLNGIVDAMSFGNHDADYGASKFERCRESIDYPILGANVVDADGKELFKRFVVFETGGVRIGAFAVMGSDFPVLLKPEHSPAPGVRFTDRIAAARSVVAALREKEKVSAVVLIGHAQREDDEALAREVPGIDLILGTHSHIRQDLVRIDGTRTWFISPSQYLTWISRVELRFHNGALQDVSGRLIPVDSSMMADRRITRRVARMQRALDRDPKYRELLVTLGTVASELSLENQLHEQTVLGRFVMEIVRRAAKADLALSTTSSFRQPISPGTITLEDLRATLPYPNRILVYQLTGEEVVTLLQRSVEKRGTDSFGQFSGMTPRVIDGRVIGAEIGGAAIDPAGTYRIATTDYLATVNPGWHELFRSKSAEETGLEVRDEVRKYIETHGTVK